MATSGSKKKLCENAHLVDKDNDKVGKYVCDGCKTDGKGPKYICSGCNGYFHEKCYDFKPSFCPPMFQEEKGSYKFKFSWSIPPPRKKNCPDGRTSRNCEACGMPVEGYAYRCQITDKDLHPPCAFLDKDITVPLADDNKVKLVLIRKDQQVMLNSNVNDCCFVCRGAELPAPAAALNEKIPGWCYLSDDGKIRFHVFCMLQIWFNSSTEAETSDNNGGRKQLGELDGNEQQTSQTTTQDIIKYSKKNQGEGSSSAITEVIINGSTGPKLQELDKTTQDDSKKKKKKKGNFNEYCMKVLGELIPLVISALFGDLTGLAGYVVVKGGKLVYNIAARGVHRLSC